jgi:hypothetical protein
MICGEKSLSVRKLMKLPELTLAVVLPSLNYCVGSKNDILRQANLSLSG